MSYEDAREAALDVFKANHLELSQQASAIAFQRAEELTDRILERIHSTRPELLATANDPGVLKVLYQAQEGFASSGDSDLEEVLQRLVVERMAADERTTLQVAVSAAVSAVPGLTRHQMNALTVRWLINSVTKVGLHNPQQLWTFLESNLAPFVRDLPVQEVDYTYLISQGVAVQRIARTPLGGMLAQKYPGLLSHGAGRNAFHPEVGKHIDDERLFRRCERDETMFRVNAATRDEASVLGGSLGLAERLADAQAVNLLTSDEVEEELRAASPPLERLIEIWSSTALGLISVTAVGIAIAHANWQAVVGAEAPLSTWLHS